MGRKPAWCIFAFLTISSLSADPPSLWRHLSTTRSELPLPSESRLAAGMLGADFDADGTNDFVIAFADVAPALVLFYRGTNWTRLPIELEYLPLARGGAAFDIDGDQDLDIVFGSASGKELWWWENPSPRFDSNKSWTRHLIKNTGSRGNGSAIFADVIGWGGPQLVFWGQSSNCVFVAPVPDQPRAQTNWALTPIFSPPDARVRARAEGALGISLSAPDINMDGITDLLAGRFWLRRTNGTQFESTHIGGMEGRSTIGRFRDSTYPQIVIAPDKAPGAVFWYECKSQPGMPGSWAGRQLTVGDVNPVITLVTADFDRDGQGDILLAEASIEGGALPSPSARIFYSDGRGNFRTEVFPSEVEMYDAQVLDLDNDGDVDIASVPRSRGAPRLDIWLNQIPRREPVTYPK